MLCVCIGVTEVEMYVCTSSCKANAQENGDDDVCQSAKAKAEVEGGNVGGGGVFPHMLFWGVPENLACTISHYNFHHVTGLPVKILVM